MEHRGRRVWRSGYRLPYAGGDGLEKPSWENAVIQYFGPVLLGDVLDLSGMCKISQRKIIMRHLIDSQAWVTINELADVVYASTEDGGPLYFKDTISICILVLRRRLKPGFSIDASGSGYYKFSMTPEKAEEILLQGVADAIAA